LSVLITGENPRDCIESLEKLNYPDYEVVLVDDGSKDDTVEIVDRFLSRYSPPGSRLKGSLRWRRAGTTIQEAGRLRYIRQKNMGLSFARNIGAYLSKGAFCLHGLRLHG